MPASHAVRIASSSELRSGVNCNPCGSSPNLFGREVATGVYIGQQAAGMSDPTELRSGQERGHGILELCFGAICSPCETSANAHIGQQVGHVQSYIRPTWPEFKLYIKLSKFVQLIQFSRPRIDNYAVELGY